MSRGAPVVLSWAAFQPRTAGIAQAIGGTACFIYSRRLGRAASLLPLRYAWDAMRTWRRLQELDPTHVVAVSPPLPAALLAAAWCRAHRRAFAVDCHTGAFAGRKWGWTRPLHRLLFRRAAAVVFNTAEEAEMAAAWGARAIHVPDDMPGVEHADAVERTAAPRVLVAGSFDGSEPVAAILAAAARLPGIELRLTGDPARLPPSVRSCAPPNVAFTGYLPYARFLGEMRAADVVAVFSADGAETGYRLNRASCEAIGLERPLVLLDTPGNRSNFGDAAVLCAAEPGGMAQALEQALAQKTALAERSHSIRLRLEAQRQDRIQRLQAMLRREDRASALYVTQHVYPNHSVVRRNVEHLLAQGIEIDLVCMASTNVPDWPAGHPQLRLHRIRLNHRRSPAFHYLFEYVYFFARALPIVLALSVRRPYAVVQVDNPPEILVLLALPTRLRGAHVVLFFHELLPELLAARLRRPGAGLLIALAARLERIATLLADRVTVPSAACARILVGRGVSAARISIVPNVVAQELTGKETRVSGAPVLITHGSLIERYGVQVAIKALAELTCSWPELTLRVLGDGEYKPALQRLVADLGISERVIFQEFIPWREAMAEVRAATIGLVPVIPDGYGELLLPTKLFDYALTGTPAVCSRLSTIAEQFPPDAVAYFPPGDHRALARQIDRLLRDPDAARRQANRAREVACPEKVYKAYVAALGLAPVAATA